MLNISATQELARKLVPHSTDLTALQAENRQLKARLAALEAKDAARDARLAAIEKQLSVK
jgi:regulator of replication initiation timing